MFITSEQLFNILKSIDWKTIPGNIKFNLANINVIITTTDTVGITLQSWLKQYLNINNFYFREPNNTQEFPDFFLSDNDFSNLLEVKAFNYNNTPAFDIANFESYCESLISKPYRLHANYLIFGYEMDSLGNIYIKDIWLKKIWDIAGKSSLYPLKTQVKRGMIYNIRPNSNFKNYTTPPFSSKDDFISAIYGTLYKYKDPNFAQNWINKFNISYSKYYNSNL